ncbi:DUF6193 family natural product biosynthesis protein [Streptomyces sp. NPDC000983]|uniref:DUF6193 family natural product biosynthesis protein n=1 Tax=Streptomyces sp. NPDC000983 TaxID=3154373 RepID=UPI00331EA03B
MTDREAEDRVEAKWRTLLAAPYVDTALVRAAHAEPRLRQLFPWSGHGELHFSRRIDDPWTWDIPFIRPQPGGRFRIEGPSRSEYVGEVHSVEAAVAAVADRLPPGCGPAVLGPAGPGDGGTAG